MNAADAVLAPLDAGRALVLRRLGPIAPRLLADRELRVGIYGVLCVLTAFVVTCVAPLGPLAFGPIVLGVPHLVADVRYLLVRTGVHRRVNVCLAMGVPVLAAALTGHIGLGLLAPIGVAIVAESARWKKVPACAFWMALVLSAYAHPHLALVALVYGHNLLAVVVFWAWRARRQRYHWPALVAFFGAVALLASGWINSSVEHILALLAPRSRALFDSIVRGLTLTTDPALALRLVLTFAFMQSVHYAVWLRLLPEEDRDRPGLRSFASSYRALESDVGRPLLLVTCVALAGILGWAFVDVAVARLAYLSVAGLHVYLEFGVVTLLLLEGRLPLRCAS